MEIQSEKTKHPAVGTEEWDGPSKKNLHVVVPDGLFRRQMSRLAQKSPLINNNKKTSSIKYLMLAWLMQVYIDIVAAHVHFGTFSAKVC